MDGYKFYFFISCLASSLLFTNCNKTKFPYGERIFLNKCADCHMDDGQGLSALYPSLKNNKIGSMLTDLPCIIRYGIDDTSSLIKMLPMPEISDVEITNVINYINNDLNKNVEEVYLPDVQNILANCIQGNDNSSN